MAQKLFLYLHDGSQTSVLPVPVNPVASVGNMH